MRVAVAGAGVAKSRTLCPEESGIGNFSRSLIRDLGMALSLAEASDQMVRWQVMITTPLYVVRLESSISMCDDLGRPFSGFSVR